MIPKFLDNIRGLKNPINKDGKPAKYISLLIPLIRNTRTKKEDMLIAAGVDTSNIQVKGYYSEYYSQYTRADILKWNATLRFWERGKNWNEYLGFIISQLCEVEQNGRKISRMFRVFDSNSANFMVSLLDEQDGDKINAND